MGTLQQKSRWKPRKDLSRLKMAFDVGAGNDALAHCVRLCWEDAMPLPGWASKALLTQLSHQPGRNSRPIPPTDFECEKCESVVPRVSRNQKLCSSCVTRKEEAA
jgi:hypothetical protein